MPGKDVWWLPRDERELLMLYARDIPRWKDSKTYPTQIPLMKALGFREEEWEGDPSSFPYFEMVEDANDMLIERGLIRIEKSPEGMDVHISFTPQGWHLARKYAAGRISRIQLRFMEYRQHWILLALAWFLAVTIASLVSTAITLWVIGKPQ